MASAKKPVPKAKQSKYVEAVGRRREASARVRFYTAPKTGSISVQQMDISRGDIIVNGKRVQEYFPGAVSQREYLAPLKCTDTEQAYAISIRVIGGGKQGQLGAAVHGMARVLDKIDSEQYRPSLKKRGFLTRDSRMRERRKAGYAQKARARKQSPKR
jgi:small subunit ribosomal protein S9